MTVYAVVASDSNNTMDESVDVFEKETDAKIWRLGSIFYDLIYRQQDKNEVDILDSISRRIVNDGLTFISALQDEYEEVVGRHVWIYDL